MKMFTRGRVSALVALSFAVLACSKPADSAADSTAANVADSAGVQAPAVSDTGMAAAATTPTASIVPININTATDAEILAIPGVGKKILHEFKEYRPYTSIEQFRREIGKYVDKAELSRLEQYIVIK